MRENRGGTYKVRVRAERDSALHIGDVMSSLPSEREFHPPTLLKIRWGGEAHQKQIQFPFETEWMKF
jgi:hypothetical protein